MPLKGDLETVDLSCILQLLYNERKTGIFRVNNQKTSVQIYIQDGIIIYAMSSRKETRLGSMLFENNIISAGKLKECLDQARKKRLALGKILVEHGYVSQEQLSEFIYKQVEGILYEMFLWEEAEFEFEVAPICLDGMIVTEMNTYGIILEASRRADEQSLSDRRAQEQLPKSDTGRSLPNHPK